MATKLKRRKKNGRPEHAPTTNSRRKVSVGAAFGMTQADIAAALEISDVTLRKYYERELTVGAQKKRFENLDAMVTAANRGNVAAQKALASTTMRAQGYVVPPIAGEAPAPIVPRGKKEQQAQDATTAAEGTHWERLLRTPGPVQ